MADIVRGQIAYADPEGPMAPNLVRGADADAVAMYIAKCAGNPNCGVTAATTPPPSSGATTTSTTSTTGGSGTAAGPDGKAIFASAGCVGCHTLKDAGATGKVGPNLDTLHPSEARVEHQVINGGGPMPAYKGQLSPAQIKAVSAYVASVAGK